MNIGNNYAVLQGISERLNLNFNDSTYYRLRKVLVIGGASPEGSITLNKRLSEKRAETLFNHLAQYGTFPDSLRHYTFLGRDWNGLIRLAEEDLELPYRDETLALLRDIAGDAKNSISGKTDAVRRLQALRGGQPYRYMYRHHFPILRASSMYLWYSEVKLPYHSVCSSLRKPVNTSFPVLEAPPLYVYEPEKEEAPAMYWALKTNLLYDALLVPNVGVEFYVDKNWSVATDWMYAWWKNDVNRRWRVYGGDLAVRRWFGRKAEAKPLTGHHLGLYAQVLTYDFCLDEKGYMGGKPGGNLWDKLNYALGVEYGYSLPVARRLNLDFTLGIGYMGGTYHEYRVVDDCKVWQATKNRQWFGPTKAEVSLVWLLGPANYNKEKGGAR